MDTIVVTLKMADAEHVECNLQTNGLPFEVVEAQLRKFVESLRWQIEERARCPFHAANDARRSEEVRDGTTD